MTDISCVVPDDEPKQIVCTGEEASDVWNCAFGTWSADDFGIASEEPVGTGERLFVNRRIYDALRTALDAAETREKVAVAAALTENCVGCCGTGEDMHGDPCDHGITPSQQSALDKMLAEERKAGRKEEREACAQIADRHGEGPYAAKDIAAAIRARTTNGEGRT